MDVFLRSLGLEIWQEIENGFKVPKTPPADVSENSFYDCNGKAKKEIVFDLVDSKFTKFMQSKSTKEMWDKIQNIMNDMTQ